MGIENLPDSGLRIALPGVFRLGDARPLFDRALTEVGAGRSIEVDLAGAEHIHAAGLQIMVALERQLVAAGGGLRLVNVSGAARDAVALCGLERWLGPESDVSPRGEVG